MENEKVIDIQSLVKSRYLIRKGTSQGHIFVLLHGFMSGAESMWNRFEARLPKESTVISLYAPYPVPVKKGQDYEVGYSWYFFDREKSQYLVGYDVCQDYVSKTLESLGYADTKKTLIGYSQGGYASVHIAEKLKNVAHIIGLSCVFKIDEPCWQGQPRVDALHGEKDDIVALSGALSAFEKLPEKHKGTFKSFKAVKHKPTEEMLDLASEWAKSHI